MQNRAHFGGSSLPNKSKPNWSIGIDLGGTKIAGGLVDTKGQVHHEIIKPTNPFGGALPSDRLKSERGPSARAHIKYVVNAISDIIEELMISVPGKTVREKRQHISGIGLASAGPMNVLEGTLIYPANFSGWKVVPLVPLIETNLKERGFSIRVNFQNDAMAAALGEGWIGHCKEKHTYAMITIGTGIGSGVVLNGKPAQSGGMGSEWGHQLVDVRGISPNEDMYSREVEGLASGTGLLLRAKARGFKGQSVAELAKASIDGNKLARELFTDAGDALTAIFYNLSLGLHLQMIVVTGGLLAIHELFLPRAIENYRILMKRKNPAFLAPVKISRFGNQIGLVGAARLPWLAQP